MLLKPNRNHELDCRKSGIITVLLLLIIPLSTISQEWIRIYGDNISCYAYSLIESDDNGYVYAGKINQDQIPKYGWIFKTDINGEMLWDKKFGEYGDVTAAQDIKQTIDNGYILSGSTKKLDPYYDPFIMKLNACGEKEWCKILHKPNNMDFGTRVVQLPNGNYIALLTYFSYVYSERIWLMCFDEAGEILWKKVYAQEYPFIDSDDGDDLLITSDSSILITGKCYYPDFPDSNTFIIRPLLIKTDFEGEEKWTTVWGKDTQFYGHVFTSIEDNKGDVFSVGQHISQNPGGYFPCLIKTSVEGEEIFFSNFPDSVQIGNAKTIAWFADSTFAIGTGWKATNGEIHYAVIKIDTLGNIIKTNEIEIALYTYNNSLTTFDNKVLILSSAEQSGNFDIYAFKFNQDLEYDTIYTQPFVYDSLCPYPIISDTIPLDCEVVGLEEERKVVEQPRLTIFPNPAKDKIRVVLPEYITTNSKTAGFNVTTWRYQFNGEIQLEIYDLYGRRWHQQVVAKGEKEAEIPVSSLPTGLYVVRAVIDGMVVSGKFVEE